VTSRSRLSRIVLVLYLLLDLRLNCYLNCGLVHLLVGGHCEAASRAFILGQAISKVACDAHVWVKLRRALVILWSLETTLGSKALLNFVNSVCPLRTVGRIFNFPIFHAKDGLHLALRGFLVVISAAARRPAVLLRSGRISADRSHLISICCMSICHILLLRL